MPKLTFSLIAISILSTCIANGDLYVLGASYTANGATIAAPVGPANPTGDAKWTNGTLWIEAYAATHGYSNPISSNRTPTTGQSATNFARGGAEIISSFPGVGGVDRPKDSGEQFSELLAYLQIHGAPTSADMFVTTSFGNDILNKYQIGQGASVDTAFLTTRVDTLVTLILNAKASGFEKLLIANSPPSTIPVLLELLDAPTLASLEADINEFNSLLDAKIKELLIQNPTLSASIMDMNQTVSGAVASPSAYGFTDSTSIIYDANGDPTGADPQTTMWWDSLHPSAGLHAAIASGSIPLVTPFVRTQPLSGGQLQVEFEGLIYHSTDLIDWTAMSPQPQSPYTIPTGVSREFYKVTWE